VDAAAFEAAIEPHIASSDNALDDASAAALQETVDLYTGTGPLLPSLYDDWCVFPREILSDKYIIALERLMAWHADPDRQNWGAALLCGRRLLAVDALLEHVPTAT
jgi:DNA-binding SARP family transcriptional activator